MSTTVCKNVQSCFETLTLKLNPPNIAHLSPSLDSTRTGWSCIESLSNASNVHGDSSDKLEVYVHPLNKRSKYTLSDKSLEMCTENLGSETGTYITESDEHLFSRISLSLGSESGRGLNPYHKTREEPRRAKYERLPPPLTTNTLSVRPLRESGRLVMTIAPRRPSIRAQRCNGRLTMSLSDGFSFLEEEGVQEEEGLEEGMDETNKKLEIGEIQWLSRCKEGGHASGTRKLINWDRFCVAT